METTQPTSRIHPLLAGAAVSVTLVSLLGVAALSGMLPNSNSSSALAQTAPATVLVQTPAGLQYMQPVSAPMANAYQVTQMPQVQPPAARSTATVRHTSSHQPAYAQRDSTYRNDNRQPTYQQPTQAANSPIGIASGAVVGGLIGNQVGGGRGRTMATVAGVIGGGYLGNIAGQRYGY